MTAVHCPNCGKKVAEALDGKLTVTCRHCKSAAIITLPVKIKTPPS